MNCWKRKKLTIDVPRQHSLSDFQNSRSHSTGGGISSSFVNRWRIAAIYPDINAIWNTSPVLQRVISGPAWWAASIQHHPTALLSTTHGQWCVRYSGQMFIVHTKLPNKRRYKVSYVYIFRPAQSILSLSKYWAYCRKRTAETDTLSWQRIDTRSWQKAIPTAKMTATGISNTFIEYWVDNFEIPSTVVMDNGPSLIPSSSPYYAKSSVSRR